jgi:hypothetical protein
MKAAMSTLSSALLTPEVCDENHGQFVLMSNRIRTETPSLSGKVTGLLIPFLINCRNKKTYL